MPAFVVGDVHGHRDVLAELLRDAGLIDSGDRWCGADSRLWLLGDLVDRGPDGIGAIDLVMALQQQADVRCLLGNHEVLLLAVSRYARVPLEGTDVTFGENWSVNGGRISDLRRLQPPHQAWLQALPPIGREGAWLLVHADTTRYLELGTSPAEIAASSERLLGSDDPVALGHLLDIVSDRHAFQQPGAARLLLDRLGGDRIVHGHTPIFYVAGLDPETVTEPLVYDGGRVLNVDHCLFAGGPGFVIRLDEDGWAPA